MSRNEHAKVPVVQTIPEVEEVARSWRRLARLEAVCLTIAGCGGFFGVIIGALGLEIWRTGRFLSGVGMVVLFAGLGARRLLTHLYACPICTKRGTHYFGKDACTNCGAPRGQLPRLKSEQVYR